MISPDYVSCLYIPRAIAIFRKKLKFWKMLVRRRRPLWCYWRLLCGFENFEKKIQNFEYFFAKFENYGEFGKITIYNFQSRRQILTIGGVYVPEGLYEIGHLHFSSQGLDTPRPPLDNVQKILQKWYRAAFLIVWWLVLLNSCVIDFSWQQFVVD